jgi:hypothetical protein
MGLHRTKNQGPRGPKADMVRAVKQVSALDMQQCNEWVTLAYRDIQAFAKRHSLPAPQAAARYWELDLDY